MDVPEGIGAAAVDRAALRVPPAAEVDTRCHLALNLPRFHLRSRRSNENPFLMIASIHVARSQGLLESLYVSSEILILLGWKAAVASPNGLGNFHKKFPGNLATELMTHSVAPDPDSPSRPRTTPTPRCLKAILVSAL